MNEIFWRLRLSGLDFIASAEEGPASYHFHWLLCIHEANSPPICSWKEKAAWVSRGDNRILFVRFPRIIYLAVTDNLISTIWTYNNTFKISWMNHDYLILGQ